MHQPTDNKGVQNPVPCVTDALDIADTSPDIHVVKDNEYSMCTGKYVPGYFKGHLFCMYFTAT